MITHLDKDLPNASKVNKQPSEFEKFWALTENKIGLQQYFISWIVETYKGNIPVYLGGCSSNDRNSASKIVDGHVSTVQSLRCFYDEADDRLMYHLNQAIKCDHIEVAHVLTGDTDIFVNLMYNFGEWSEHGLEDICTHHLNKSLAIHESVKNRPGYVVELLPSIHALPVCDKTSKVAHKAVYISTKGCI